MIVFNAFAIAVGLIIGIFLGPLYWAFPVFMETTWGNVLAASIVTIVGVLTDLIGIKGRVFWLPIWLFGLIAVGVNLYTQWGWYGPALAGAVVVAVIAGLLVLASVQEKKEWANAPANLNAARDALARGVSDETWELIEKAFFVPSSGDCTPEQCRHNLEVLALTRKALQEKEGPLELRVFEAIGLAYRAGMVPRTEGSEKLTIPSEFTSAMSELLGNKGALRAAEDRKDLLEALLKPVETPTT